MWLQNHPNPTDGTLNTSDGSETMFIGFFTPLNLMKNLIWVLWDPPTWLQTHLKFMDCKRNTSDGSGNPP